MHAASVHPEPGSNSLKMLYIQEPQLLYTSRVCLALFTLELILNSKEFSELCLSCCSIFKELLAIVFRDSFVIISDSKPFVKYFFKVF